jgi:polyisoprenyl-teichoic acid--peptidoglycan teichoic acid transferase
MQHAFKRKLQVKIVPLLKPILIIGILFLFILGMYRVLSPAIKFAGENNLTVPFFWNLIIQKKSNLAVYKGRTNIALFGIPGGNHDGATLTDSIMVLSIDFTKKDMLIISIPRDIWLGSLKDKINSGYAYGEAKKSGGGIILAKASVEEVIGQPIHYAWVVDFSGFTKLVDLVDGVDINVETGFEDKKYPIAGKENDTCNGDTTFSCRYEDLVFEKGIQHMDGQEALKYVRSRYASGDEGTDFARGRRQQKVIVAIKDKIVQPSFYSHPANVQKLIQLLDAITTTDMRWAEIISIAKAYFFDAKDMPIRHISLDWGDPNTGKKGYLINPPAWKYNDTWVLVPRSEDFEEIHSFIDCQTQSLECKMQP